jgi:hypothetical protein
LKKADLTAPATPVINAIIYIDLVMKCFKSLILLNLLLLLGVDITVVKKDDFESFYPELQIYCSGFVGVVGFFLQTKKS